MNNEKWDPVWEEIFSQHEWGKYPSEDLIRFVARNFYRSADRSLVKILEVGCGPGGNLWFIAREGFQAYGIDGSETAIQRATKRLNEEVPDWKGNLVVGDFSKLPFDNELFDAVIDNEALYCSTWEKSKIVLNEVHRVLKPEGQFYSRTFASGTQGDGTGTKVATNTWIVSEGTLKDKGPSRFTSEEQISSLYDRFNIYEKNLLRRTVEGTSSGAEIKEWIICARKAK